ncbi:MAG: BRO family protein [Patescibacteria group bacterium]
MESSQLKLLLKTLDDIRHKNGVEYWYARELYPILGYSRWENFETPLNKAKESCRKAGSEVNSHFHDVMKMVKIGLDLEKTVSDVKLTRYACYLIAINGNPKKEEIAFEVENIKIKPRWEYSYPLLRGGQGGVNLILC